LHRRITSRWDLRWLARHPSGVRYRAEIARVMSEVVPRPGDWQR
jgi:hypothetical protein